MSILSKVMQKLASKNELSLDLSIPLFYFKLCFKQSADDFNIDP